MKSLTNKCYDNILSDQLEIFLMKKRKLSEEINAVIHVLAQNHLTVGELLAVFGLRGLALISIVFSLPFLLPIPLPGLSSVLCWVIIFCGLGILTGKMPWLPKKLTAKKIPLDPKILEKLKGLTEKFENLIGPRFYPRHPLMGRLMGGLIVFGAILLGLPLPPGGNFLPALAIILISLGYLESDGIATLLGVLILCVFFVGIILMADWIHQFLLTKWKL